MFPLTLLLPSLHSICLQSSKGSSFISIIPSFIYIHSPAEITLIVILFVSSILYRSKKIHSFFALPQFLQLAIMIVPNISTIILASMGIASAVNAYSPNFANFRAALERRQQVSTQIFHDVHNSLTHKKEQQPTRKQWQQRKQRKQRKQWWQQSSSIAGCECSGGLQYKWPSRWCSSRPIPLSH